MCLSVTGTQGALPSAHTRRGEGGKEGVGTFDLRPFTIRLAFFKRVLVARGSRTRFKLFRLHGYTPELENVSTGLLGPFLRLCGARAEYTPRIRRRTYAHVGVL